MFGISIGLLVYSVLMWIFGNVAKEGFLAMALCWGTSIIFLWFPWGELDFIRKLIAPVLFTVFGAGSAVTAIVAFFLLMINAFGGLTKVTIPTGLGFIAAFFVCGGASFVYGIYTVKELGMIID
jgi:hypothetical protein